jgi:hypothetical protein
MGGALSESGTKRSPAVFSETFEEVDLDFDLPGTPISRSVDLMKRSDQAWNFGIEALTVVSWPWNFISRIGVCGVEGNAEEEH